MATKFSREYKLECVELVSKHGYGVKEAAEAMNVDQSSLQRWVRQYKNEHKGITPNTSALTPEQTRIQA